jgi:hypothetical protein
MDMVGLEQILVQQLQYCPAIFIPLMFRTQFTCQPADGTDSGSVKGHDSTETHFFSHHEDTKKRKAKETAERGKKDVEGKRRN